MYHKKRNVSCSVSHCCAADWKVLASGEKSQCNQWKGGELRFSWSCDNFVRRHAPLIKRLRPIRRRVPTTFRHLLRLRLLFGQQTCIKNSQKANDKYLKKGSRVYFWPIRNVSIVDRLIDARLSDAKWEGTSGNETCAAPKARKTVNRIGTKQKKKNTNQSW